MHGKRVLLQRIKIFSQAFQFCPVFQAAERTSQPEDPQPAAKTSRRQAVFRPGSRQRIFHPPTHVLAYITYKMQICQSPWCLPLQIKKNIAAILQNRLKCFGKKKLKFSEELGLPRFILQSFLKGNADLRSDSFEELTKCLGFIPAQLISSLEYAQAYCTSHLDPLSAEVQSLHPQAQTLAKGEVLLLHAGFRILAEFKRLDRFSDTV